MFAIFLFFTREYLQHAIPSATGLAVLLMGTMFPIMIGLNIPSICCGVIATSLALLTPQLLLMPFVVQAVDLGVVEYVLYYQGLRRLQPYWLLVLHISSGSPIGGLVVVPQLGKMSEEAKLIKKCTACAYANVTYYYGVSSSNLFVEGIHLDVV